MEGQPCCSKSAFSQNPEPETKFFIDPILTSDETTSMLSKTFCNPMEVSFPPGTQVTPLSDPFVGFYIDDFLKEVKYSGFISQLISDLEALNKAERKTKIYHCNGVASLKSDQTTTIANLQKLFQNQVGPWIQKILGHNNLALGEMTCYSFKQGNYINCNSEKEPLNLVTFFLFLGPEDWNEDDDGGMFNLFEECNSQATSIVQSILPLTNRLLIYKSSHYNFMEMTPVRASDKDGLVIRGHFNLVQDVPRPRMQQPEHSPDFKDWLNPLYRTDCILDHGRQQFRSYGEVKLVDFLEPGIFVELSQALTLESNHWISVGPPNVRKYDVLTLDPDTTIGRLSNLMQSTDMWNFLLDLTGIDQDLKNSKVNRISSCQVRRWKSQYYKVMDDDDDDDENLEPRMKATLTFNCNSFPFLHGGTTVDVLNDNERVLTPVENALHVIYLDEDSFSYTNKLMSEEEYQFQDIVVTYCTGKSDDADEMDEELMMEDVMNGFDSDTFTDENYFTDDEMSDLE